MGGRSDEGLISISPSGTLPSARTVNVILTVRDESTSIAFSGEISRTGFFGEISSRIFPFASIIETLPSVFEDCIEVVLFALSETDIEYSVSAMSDKAEAVESETEEDLSFLEVALTESDAPDEAEAAVPSSEEERVSAEEDCEDDEDELPISKGNQRL